MSQILRAALWRWSHLEKLTLDRIRGLGTHDFSSWMEHDVCPVVQECLRRRDFQHNARWSIDNLAAPDSVGEAAQLIREIELHLTEQAGSLAEAVRRSCQEVSALSEEWRQRLSSLEYLAGHPWNSLATELDYFGLSTDLNLNEPESLLSLGNFHQAINHAEFLPIMDPELRVPGDYIWRGLEKRINHWKSQLQRSIVAAQRNLSRAEFGSAWKKFVNLDRCYQRLRHLIRNGPGTALRDACVALVQIYAAYFPRVEMEWLGSARTMISLAESIAARVKRDPEDCLRIAHKVALALAEVEQLYVHDEDDPILLAEQEAARTRLCLLECPGERRMYWDGELVDVDWLQRRRSWTLMVALVESALKSGSGVDDDCELGISLRSARGELRRLLPLRMLPILEIRDGVHRLALAKDEVSYVCFERTERLLR